jgi:hypothetical protein
VHRMERNSGAFLFAELETLARIQSMYGSSLLREGGSRASLPEGWKILNRGERSNFCEREGYSEVV